MICRSLKMTSTASSTSARSVLCRQKLSTRPAWSCIALRSRNVSPPGIALVGRLRGAMREQSLVSSTSTQIALANYLEHGGFDKHLRKLRQTLEKQQRVFAQAIGHYFPEGTLATRPAGGYFVWVELPPGADSLEIQSRALKLGICVAPGPIFSARPHFKNFLRLNYGHPWNERTEWALATLGRVAATGHRCSPA